jgi:hypothetical protein
MALVQVVELNRCDRGKTAKPVGSFERCGVCFEIRACMDIVLQS